MVWNLAYPPNPSPRPLRIVGGMVGQIEEFFFDTDLPWFCCWQELDGIRTTRLSTLQMDHSGTAGMLVELDMGEENKKFGLLQ